MFVAWRANKGVTLEDTRMVVDLRLEVALKSWRLAQDMVDDRWKKGGIVREKVGKQFWRSIDAG